MTLPSCPVRLPSAFQYVPRVAPVALDVFANVVHREVGIDAEKDAKPCYYDNSYAVREQEVRVTRQRCDEAGDKRK